MGIQDLGAIGEFISSVAIVITLIFLTMETRQARNATQQSNRQARHRIRTDLNLASAVNPQLCEIMAKSMQHLSGDSLFDFADDFGLSYAEGVQFTNYSLTYFTHFEDQFFSDLPESDRRSLENQIRALLNLPVFSGFWELFRNRFDNRFREYMDNLVRDGIGESS